MNTPDEYRQLLRDSRALEQAVAKLVADVNSILGFVNGTLVVCADPDRLGERIEQVVEQLQRCQSTYAEMRGQR